MKKLRAAVVTLKPKRIGRVALVLLPLVRVAAVPIGLKFADFVRRASCDRVPSGSRLYGLGAGTGR